MYILFNLLVSYISGLPNIIVVMFCIGCVHFWIQYCVFKYVQGHRDLQIALPAEGKSDSLHDTQAI